MKHIFRKFGFVLLAVSLCFSCDAKKTAENTDTTVKVAEAENKAGTESSNVKSVTSDTPEVTEDSDADEPPVLQEVNDDEILQEMKAEIEKEYKLCATAENCILYEDADTKSPHIATLPEDTVVKVIEENGQKTNEWKQIKTRDSITSWCFRDTLKPIETTAKAIALEIKDRKAGIEPKQTNYNNISPTPDYLQLYAGEYVFDSMEIIEEENTEVDAEKIKNSKITISYDNKNKCLFCPYKQLMPDSSEDKTLYFAETALTEPFFWMYGESAGFVERMAWFYNGGIALTEELHTFEFDDDHNITADVKRKYTVFYKRML